MQSCRSCPSCRKAWLAERVVCETGGGVRAEVGSMQVSDDGWVDDQWWLQPDPGGRTLPLRPMAAVALVLAAKVLLGWPAPVRLAEEREAEPELYRPWPS